MRRTDALRAMESTLLVPRDRYVYSMLLHRADNDTCEIPDQWQPKNHDDRRVFGGMAPRTVRRALAHLNAHGWVQWKPLHRGREGRPSNRYELAIGTPCDCRVSGHSDPKPTPRVSGHSDRQATEFPANMTASFRPEFPATSQVSPPICTEGIAPKGSSDLNPPTTCAAPGCPKPPRRSCRTCWDHALEWELAE
jgi:hypothetical protein